ncbi:MAG: hypothetical protein JKY42_12545 [Flavobacteriales bacterium]|nr:hypothetical protein [Flavobacteriales bacterium]
MSINKTYKLMRAFLLLAVFCLVTKGSLGMGGAPAGTYTVNPFPDQYWCQAAPYPTAYSTLTWSISEDDVKNFKKDGVRTIIIDLPAGFEFDMTSATASVAASVAGDILSASFVYNSVTQITATFDVDDDNVLDNLVFSNFEIRASTFGISGNVLRTGGTLKIDGVTTNPTASESMGFLAAGIPMVVDSIRVNQISSDIKRNCGNNR